MQGNIHLPVHSRYSPHISTSLMTQEGKVVGKKLTPQQLAVSVSDGCAIFTSALHASTTTLGAR
jgi:hypothetical protein